MGLGLRPGEGTMTQTHMFFTTREEDVSMVLLGRVGYTFVSIVVCQVDDGRVTLVAHLRGQGQVTQVL